MNPSAATSRAFHAIFAAGSLCGVLDITAAFVTAYVTRGMKPGRLLQGIASGLLGAKAFNGGWESAALGLACHFFIAFAAATVFYIASRQLTLMTRRPIFSGVLYGIAVYTVMYWIVVPFVFGPRPFNWNVTVVAIVTHIVCVGTPISLVVHRHST